MPELISLDSEGESKTCSQNRGCTVPPTKHLARLLTALILLILSWSVLWTVIGQDAQPGGNIFGILTVMVFSSVGGLLVKCIPHLSLPPLLGMLIAGFMLRNVPHIDFASHIEKKWSSSLRSIALVIILMRSGLGLNTDALRRLKFTVMRLAFLPCATEAVIASVMAYYLLDMRWQWAFQLGFVQAAVSLAVVIPSLLELQAEYYGVEKGIPTLVMAAASFDNVLSISGFGVCLGLSYHSGNLVFNIFRGPIELSMGIVFGVIVGVICWYFPSKDQENVHKTRFVILLGSALLSVFGSNAARFAGAGALGVLTMATVAAHGWGKEAKIPIAEATAFVWKFFEPLLFGLVGAEVSVKYMETSLVGTGLGILAVALLLRLLVTFVVLARNNLTKKEKIFISIAWLPKATVQAAIGSVSLDMARQAGLTGTYQETYGIQILTVAVLSILVTSPIGAIGISLAGPRMLTQTLPTEDEDDVTAKLNENGDVVVVTAV
ncbi:sodium/hydrogen exchanger 9B2-like [Actinia tenebrosa]|uniref:Sodium/hydrogen exchanger 9B2-like n=1 Tax=Actinia tenebrosa TaxID=6105 RepID=A0A6P8I944_ACTTE|nr:sodium/hydrogen exchanger 9B2-like [Actinia tenebrosa]